MLLHSYIVFGAVIIISKVTSDSLSPKEVGELLLAYENYIKASLTMDKSDRSLLDALTAEYQVKQVNVTSHYRLDMTRHLEHSFRGKKSNPKWKNCLSIHQQPIDQCKSSYLADESECLKTANSADAGKVQAVRQVENEIRKWRKSYKYLSNTCKRDNPDDQEAASLCLVQYIKQDNYDVAFQRLIILKSEAMENVLLEIARGLFRLEECLKTSLSRFLDSVRNIMGTLATCYDKLNREKEDK